MNYPKSDWSAFVESLKIKYPAMYAEYTKTPLIQRADLAIAPAKTKKRSR